MGRHRKQIDGDTADVMNIEPLTDKYRAFGWHVIDIDGHDMDTILDAFSEARSIKGKPSVILARTIMGKGVAFLLSVLLFPIGLLAWGFVDGASYEVCEACNGDHDDCPHCGGF